MVQSRPQCVVRADLPLYSASTDFYGRSDISQSAYSDALERLREEFRHDKKALEVLESNTSMSDFKRTVEQVMADYSARRRRSRCARVLTKLSARVMYYGNVLDLLAQYHPEYVALVWGSAKLVLMVSTLYSVYHYRNTNRSLRASSTTKSYSHTSPTP
jgi:hypothetical protein